MLTAKYGDKLAGFIEEPLVASAFLPNVQAAVEKGDMNAERAAALAVAADASDALASTNPCCTAWDFKVVIDPLANNVAEGASDLIKMNAVRALGNLKAGGTAALAGVLESGDAKEELKVAAATALGQVLSRMELADDGRLVRPRRPVMVGSAMKAPAWFATCRPASPVASRRPPLGVGTKNGNPSSPLDAIAPGLRGRDRFCPPSANSARQQKPANRRPPIVAGVDCESPTCRSTVSPAQSAIRCRTRSGAFACRPRACTRAAPIRQ
jgi:hypothetical protein